MHQEFYLSWMCCGVIGVRVLVCCRLGEEYENITTTALSPPANTAELMDFIAYVRKVENETVFLMENRMRQICKYMLFLADYTTFTPVEMKQNCTTFQWYLRMPSVFDEHRLIVEQKTVEYQEFLKVSTACVFTSWKC